MSKHKEKKLEKATDKVINKPDKDQVPMGIKVISLLILGIMLLSLVSFAFLQSPPQSQDQMGNNVNEEGIPESLEFQEIETQQGESTWAAIKNYEVFEFQNPEVYRPQEDMEQVADQLNTLQQVEIYQSPEFENSNALYLLEKYLSASNIENTRVEEQQCNENTIYLTNKQEDLPQGCMVISAEEGEEETRVEAVLYHSFQ